MGSLDREAKPSSGHNVVKRFVFSFGRCYALAIVGLAAVSTMAVFEAAHHGTARWCGNLVQASLTDVPGPAAPADSSVNTFSRLAPQEQAEQLLGRAIARDPGSVDLIGQ